MIFQILYLTGFIAVILAVFAYLFFNKTQEDKQKNQGNGKRNDGLITLEVRSDGKSEYPGSIIAQIEEEDSESDSEVIDAENQGEQSQENKEVFASEKHQDEKVQANNEEIDQPDEEIESVFMQTNSQTQQSQKINEPVQAQYQPSSPNQPQILQQLNQSLLNISQTDPLKEIQHIISQQNITQLQNYQESIRTLAAQLQQKQKLCRIDTEQIMTNMQVKDVISQCQEQSYIVEEIHSQAEKIEILQAPLKKNSKRLKAVKEHYKSIIDELKRKLEELCIRHNETLEDINMNQTVTFSQEESMSFLEEESRGQLEVKVEEVTSLKNELQLHEEIITNLIEEDGKLKDKLRSLEIQNENLKSVLSSSSQPQQKQPQNQEKLIQSRQYQDQVIQSNPNSKVQDLLCKSGFKNSAVQSRIIQLYTSQIISPNSFNNSLLTSQIFPKQSMISMMSAVVQGALSIGMLGQCRFLNEISKKFAIGQVRKCMKRKVNDAELVYSYNEENQVEVRESVYPIIKEMKNVLFLMKLSSQKNIGIFAEEIHDEDHPIDEEVETKLLFLDLSKRKGYPREGTCKYQENQLFFGQNSLFLTQYPPFKIRRLDEELSHLLDDETQKISFLAIHYLTLQENK